MEHNVVIDAFLLSRQGDLIMLDLPSNVSMAPAVWQMYNVPPHQNIGKYCHCLASGFLVVAV